MAKLTGLLHQIASLKEQLSVCNQAYINLNKKYRMLSKKYSYEETRELIKKVDKARNINKKLIL